MEGGWEEGGRRMGGRAEDWGGAGGLQAGSWRRNSVHLVRSEELMRAGNTYDTLA